MSPTTFDLLSIAASSSADNSAPEVSEVLEYISENPDYTEVLCAILEQTTAANENLTVISSYTQQIYTVVVYLLALLIFYGIGKLISSLFVT